MSQNEISVDDMKLNGFRTALRQLIDGENSEHFVDFKFAMMNEAHENEYILALVRAMREEIKKSFAHYYFVGEIEDKRPPFRVY